MCVDPLLYEAAGTLPIFFQERLQELRRLSPPSLLCRISKGFCILELRKSAPLRKGHGA